jgi:hypothetical protein
VRGAPVIALVVLAVAAAVPWTPSANARVEPGAGRPKTPSVGLGSGEVEGDSWAASVRRERAAGDEALAGKNRACVEVRTAALSGGGTSLACGFARPLTPSGGPLWATSSEPDEARTETAMTAVVIVFAPVTAYFKAARSDGTLETINLKRLTADQARTAGLERLRYAAFATAGPWCVTHLESFDRAGQRLWQSGDVQRKFCASEW